MPDVADPRTLPDGALFEKLVLGQSSYMETKGGEPPYLRYRNAFRRVIRSMPKGKMFDPSGYVAQLYEAVRLALTLEKGKLEFYPCVGSSLDRYHGIDAFFLLSGIPVTLDLTTFPAQKRALHVEGRKLSKADFIIHPDNFFDSEGRLSAKRIVKLALAIAERWKLKRAMPRVDWRNLPLGVCVDCGDCDKPAA